MKLAVVTAGFYDRDYEEKGHRLSVSAEKFNIPLTIYGKGVFFSFYESKINELGVTINNLRNDFTHVLYTDFADSFFLSGLDEIIGKYQMFNSPLVVSGEQGIYPFPELDVLFDRSTTYPFMNPGNFIGEIPYVLDTLSALKTYSWVQNNDQAHWMLGLKDGRIKVTVDTEARIFQAMAGLEWWDTFEIEDGRVKNIVTGTKPCVVHFNGPKGGTPNEQLMERVFQACLG